MSFELVTYRIEQIADVIGGGTPSTKREDFYGGDIPWITPKDLSGYSDVFISNGARNITELGLKSSSARTLPKNSILFTSRAPIGYVAIAEKEVSTNQGFKSLIPKSNLLDYKFAYYMMMYYAPRIEAIASGSTFKEVSGSVVKNFEVTIPKCIKAQREIAETLFSLDAGIQNNTRMNQTLEKIAQRIFKSWFIDFDPVKANAEGVPFADLSPDIQSLFPSEFVESEMGLIPKGWGVSSLGKISEFQNGYAFKASTLSHDRSENSIAVLKMGNIKKGGGFKWDGSKDYYELPDGKLGKLAKHLAKRGDLLMSMTDMKANVALLGHTACMPVDDEFLVNQRVGHIKVIDSRIADFPFLYLQTNENSFIHELRAQANSGVQVNLSTAAIKAAKVVLPTTDVHQAFNQVVKPLFERIFANELQNRTLTKVRDKLLPKLLSGSIEINGDIEEQIADAS